MGEVLTTGEAAKLCGVSYRTIIRWIEQGRLQGYRLPGRGDHRVPMEGLRRFMRANAIPEPPEWEKEPARRILIAEDEPAMAHAMERALKQDGFETALAGDGLQAAFLLPSFKPGLLTLDIRMPGLDGTAVLAALKAHPLPFDCKVLVASGETPERLQEALALGADGILPKPFSHDELLAAVHRLYGDA